MIHEKPSVCGTWDPRCTDGWYLGPALQHYRCYQVHCSKTNRARISDTIELITKPDPALLLQQEATNAAQALAKTLATTPAKLLHSNFGTEQLNAIKLLSNLFSRWSSKPPIMPITKEQPASLPRVVPPQDAFPTPPDPMPLPRVVLPQDAPNTPERPKPTP